MRLNVSWSILVRNALAGIGCGDAAPDVIQPYA